MTAQPHLMTAADFEAFTELPENADRLFEFIHGEIVEKMPTNALASKITGWLIHLLWQYLLTNNLNGHVTGPDGGYRIGADRYAPDVAYMSGDKQEELENKGYNSVPPDLVVEVETNTTTTTERRLRTKILTYLAQGIVVWVVYPETQEIEVYTPDGEILKLGAEDTLDGGKVLPGFSMPVKDVFSGMKKSG